MGTSVEHSQDPERPDASPWWTPKWVAALLVVAALVPVGLPLFGIGVLHASDTLESVAPWSQTREASWRPANPLVTDTVDATVPVKDQFRDRAYDGDFALWSPFAAGGSPLASIPNASVLSPLNLPYLVAPMHWAPALSKLLELLVAALGTYLLCRRWRLGRPASLVGALAFVNTGFQVVWTNWPQSHVGALIPLLLWAVERAVSERTVGSLWPIPVVSAVMWLEGFPAVTVWAHAAAGAYALVRVVAARRARREQPAGASRERSGWRLGGRWPRLGPVAGVGGAMAVGAGLAAVQLLPFALRLGDLDLGYRLDKLEGAIPFSALSTLVVPDVLGNPAELVWYGPRNYVEVQSFVGAAVLLLAVVGLVAALRRLPAGVKGWLVGALAVCGLLVYVGGPLLDALQAVPLLGSNKIGRLRSLVGLLVALAAAVGFDRLSDGRLERRRAVWATAAAGAVLVLVAGSVLAARSQAAQAGQLGYLARQLVLPVAATVVAGVFVTALVWTGRAGSRLAAAGLVVVPLVIAVESVAFARPFLPHVETADFYPRTAAHEFLEDNLDRQRIAVSDQTMLPGTGSLYGYRTVTAHTLTPTGWADLLRAVDEDVFEASRTVPMLSATAEVATSPVLDRMGARFFVTAPQDPLLGVPVEVSPAEGAGRVATGTALTADVPAGPLRGVRLRLAERVPESSLVRLRVEVVTSDGTTVTAGERRILSSEAPGPIDIALAPPSGGWPGQTGDWRVRITPTADSDPVVLGTAAGGTPALTLIRPADDGLRVAFTDGIVAYRRAAALPRVRWAPRARVVTDPQRRVQLASRPPGVTPLILSQPGPEAGGGDAGITVTEDSGDVIRATVDAQSAGYLVVGDAIQTDWVATVDGDPAEVVAADHALGAVHVPAGRHEVTLRYDPAGFDIGLIVTALAGLLVLAGAARARRGHGGAS